MKRILHIGSTGVQELPKVQRKMGFKSDVLFFYPHPVGIKNGDFPVAEIASEEVLSLPIYPELETDERGSVVDKIWEFFG